MEQIWYSINWNCKTLDSKIGKFDKELELRDQKALGINDYVVHSKRCFITYSTHFKTQHSS